MTDHKDEPQGSAATLDRNSDQKDTGQNTWDKNSGQHSHSFSHSMPNGSTGRKFSDDESKDGHEAQEPEGEPLSEREELAQSVTAKSAIALVVGVLVPAMVILCWTLACSDRMVMLVLKHPIETIVQCVAVLNIPIANYIIWSAVTRGDLRFPLRNGILSGMSTGTALLIFGCALLANYLGYPVHDINGESRETLFGVISLAALSSALVSIYLVLKLRSLREFRSARKMSLFFSLGGLIAAILMLIGTETRPFLIRIAEYNATSEISEERDAAISTLLSMGAERDLRMECADQRAAGIPGMFIKMDPVMQRQVYFSLTGKPFRDSKASDYSAMPDDYLRRHVVGAPVENLSLVRSAMTGTMNGDNLTSAVNWTFVLKNRNYQAQEARAELILPHGAVINGVTQWAGEGSPPRTAHVGMPTQTSTGWITSTARSGTDVTDLGRDRVLVRCTSIPAQSETKLSLSIASPLSINDLQSASLLLPKFADSNFNMLSENSFRIRSKAPLHLEGKNLSLSKNSDGEFLVAGNVKGEQLNAMNVTIDCTRIKPDQKSLSTFDPITRLFFNRTIVETKQEVPSSLMIVVDGSDSMKTHVKSVIDSLKKLPASLPTSVLVASTNHSVFGNEPLPLNEALAKMSANENAFQGGQDNLESVVKAAGIAGESKNGAVLWIHGPQAGLNKELYITAPYTATPRFFEISVDKGANDAAELFKNHREIGPFTTITRTDDIAADLRHFIAKWQPGGSCYELRYNATATAAPGNVQLTGPSTREFISVCLKEEYDARVKRGHSKAAYELAYAGNIITPDNSAVISFTPATARSTFAMQKRSDTVDSSTPRDAVAEPSASSSGSVAGAPMFKSSQSDVETTAPSLSGATNGTLGTQSADATYVTGVNTAGTVRVNNLANLEALLNICANMFELIGVIGGSGLVLYGALAGKGVTLLPGFRLSRGQTVTLGIAAFVVGLAFPGIINWLVASARDANLFE